MLQLVAGLTEAYKYAVTQIRQSKPLPPFSEARSRFCLKEKALVEMIDDSPSAMVDGSHRNLDDSGEHSGLNHHNNIWGRNNKRGSRNGNKNGGGSGGGNRCGNGGGRGFDENQQTTHMPQQWQGQQFTLRRWGRMPHLAPPPPPCPYSTTSWARPPAGPTRQCQLDPGILGQRPHRPVHQRLVLHNPMFQPTLNRRCTL